MFFIDLIFLFRCSESMRLIFSYFLTMFLYFYYLISEITALEDAEMEFRTVRDEALHILTVRRSNLWAKSHSREVVYEEQFD
jgi:hypothetical protein